MTTTPFSRAATFVVADDKNILAFVPAQAAGFVNVWVTTSAGTTTLSFASFYTYTNPPPGSITGSPVHRGT